MVSRTMSVSSSNDDADHGWGSFLPVPVFSLQSGILRFLYLVCYLDIVELLYIFLCSVCNQVFTVFTVFFVTFMLIRYRCATLYFLVFGLYLIALI